MRIALMAANLATGGSKVVARSILQALPRIAPQHEYLAVVPSRREYADCVASDNVELIECPATAWWSRHVWQALFLKKRLAAFQPEWLWCLGNIGLPAPRCPQSVLMHTPLFLGYPRRDCRYAPLENLRMRPKEFLLRLAIARGLKASRRVYVQTKVVADRLSKAYGIPKERVAFCPPAFSVPVDSDDGALPSRLEPYADKFRLFFVSPYRPHKNMEIVLEVYRRYREELSESVTFLTVDQKQGPRAKALVRRIQDEGLQDHIVPLGLIAHDRIGAYYRHMHALLFPTLLETVGLSYLEAMHFSVPIIASDRDFSHEICGDAAVYVDPRSASSVKDAILRLMNSLEQRERMASVGRERAKTFFKTWDDIVRDVLDTEGIEHTCSPMAVRAKSHDD